MKDKIIQVGIIGGSGYTGGELLRVLISHPNVKIVFALSKSAAGKKWSEIHPDLTGDTEERFVSSPIHKADVVFLCLPHEETKAYLEQNPSLLESKLIDLGRAFRASNTKGFVYGLPELHREEIIKARNIANPGCFATAIQLSLLPLAKQGLLTEDIYIHATTGSTGAGSTHSPSTHFTTRHNNLSVYAPFDHPHLPEIYQGIHSLQPSFTQSIHFTPQRGPFTRGIYAATRLHCELPLNQIEDLYAKFYKSHPFVHTVKEVEMKHIINTNKCFIQLQKKGSHLLISTVLDNLLKGAAGQAVQNMNLMYQLEENSGLKFKAQIF